MALVSDNRLCIGQKNFNDKINVIILILESIDELNLKGSIVSIVK